MNHLRSKEGGGNPLRSLRHVVAMIAALMAVVTLVISILANVPTASAQEESDSNESSQFEDLSPVSQNDPLEETTSEIVQPNETISPTTSRQEVAEPKAVKKDWAQEYATKLVVNRNGVVVTDSEDDDQPLYADRELGFQYHWAVGDNEKPKPGDTMTIILPNWLTPNVTTTFTAGNYVTCDLVNKSTTVTCKFTDEVNSANSENMSGQIEFNAAVRVTQKAEKMSWGPQVVDAYFLLTGKTGGEIKSAAPQPDEQARTGNVTKGGAWSFEYEHPKNGDQKYVQILWSFVIPAEQVAKSSSFEIVDELPDFEFNDPITGEKRSLPQYIAPSNRGSFSVSRRTGAALDKGRWDTNTDNPKCRSGGDYDLENILCADKIFSANNQGELLYTPSRDGEEIMVEGIVGSGETWEKTRKIKVNLSNLKEDSAYRVAFFSVVPADHLDSKDLFTPKISNTAVINGQSIKSKNKVDVYVKFGGRSKGDPNKAEFIVRKDIKGDEGVDVDVDKFTLNYTINGEAKTCTTSKSEPCWVKNIPVGADVEIVEPAVSGSKLQWLPGEFSGDIQGKEQRITLNGNRATIAKMKSGERVVLVVTNTYAHHTGILQIRKSVQGFEQSYSPPATVDVNYTCVPSGEPQTSGKTVTVKVPTNGEIIEIENIPVGHDCYVQESVNSAEIKDHHIKVKYEPESGKVTIKEGQGENGSNLVTINNTYTLETAALSIKKAIAGERPQGLNDDTEFTVKYQCNADSKDGKVKANQLAELKINAKGDVTEGPEFPHHTRCSVKEEKTDAPKFEDYGFTADLGKEVVIGRDADANTITVTNTFKKDEAKFRVTKAISGDAQDIAAAKTYEFQYTCGQETGRLQVTGAGTVESDKAFPVGTECTVQELGTEPNGAAQIENHILSVEPNGEQRFVVGKGDNPTFTNNYTVKKAKFAVVKTAEGENGTARELTYQFDYVCGGVSGTINAKADGVPVESDKEFPVGTRCDITERHQPDILEGYEDVTEPSQRMKQVKIGVDQVVRADFKNSYAREMGKFRVTKKVVKDAELAIPGEFTVDYRCTKDGEEAKEGTLVVPADGSVDSEELPTGYACVITGEKDDQGQAQAPGATLVTEIGSGVKIAKGNVPVVQVTNTYSKNFGEFTITKSVVDPDRIADGKVFEFNYVCTPPEHRKDEKPVEGTLKVKAGESATSPKIPAEFSCTITEVGAEIIDSNLVTTGLDSKLVIEKDGSPKVDVENTYSQWKGTLEISKEISGSEAVKKAIGDHQFDVSYICIKNGKETNKGTLKVKAGETVTVPGIVANSECTVTENPDSAAVGELRFEPGASTTKVVASKIVADGGVGAAKLINAYVELGKFAVAKRVEGVHGGADDKEFKFNYTCGADSGMLTVRGNGTPVGSDKVFPVGTECTITEDADSAIIADHADVTPGAERVKKVTIGAGAPTIVGFTNTYSRDMGKFQVTKKVVTNAADLKIPGEFKVDYRCTKDGEEAKEGTLTVPNNGSVESEEMPTGYSCVVTREHDAQAPGATLVTEIGSGVKIAKGSVPAVQVTNTYSKNFGDFTITKSVVDPDGIADGKVFEFNYVCTPPEHRKDEKPVEGTLKVKAGESATSPKIPAEFSCAITEVGAEIVDSNLVTTGLDSKLVIETDKNGKVEVENKYSQWKGSLKISKAIIGTPAVEKLVGDREFDISLKCVKNDRTTNEDRVKVKAGETVTVNGIVANSVCTVEENTDAVEVQGLRFLKDSSITRVDAPKITADGGVTEAQIQNAYAELGHLSVVKEVTGLTGNIGRADREFEIIATWTDNGETVEKEFTVRDGEEFKDFPPLPVGTKVTLKEKHPGNNIVQQWRTPGFTSDRVGAVVDNRDGTAVVTIVGDTPADKPLQVKLKNTSNPPWWWLLAPFAILGLGNSGNQNGGPNDGGGNNQNGGGNNQNGGGNHQNGGTGDSSKSGTSAKSNGATLARTGASVLGVLAVAGLVTAAGIFMVRRSRKQN